MAPDVFLSYARRASTAPARALREALEACDPPIAAFLDEREIPYGDSIPATLADGLLGARVVVVLFEPVYFTRWYCRLEYRVATALFEHAPELAARHVVVAFPEPAARDARLDADLDELPSALRGLNWPSVADRGALATLIQERLAAVDEPLGAALDRVRGAGTARAILTGPAALPQPLRYAAGVPLIPAMRGSLRDEFVGRDEALWQLHQDLAPVSGRLGHAALTAALGGMGGIGKTQLAAEYFHRYGPRHYTGGVFWLDARRDVAEQHHGMLRALGDEITADFVAYREQVGAERVEENLRARLAGRVRALSPEHPVLLVVDDVPEPPVLPNDSARVPRSVPLDRWCPAPDAMACLATSRASVGFAIGSAIARRQVDLLAPEPAVAVLTSQLDGLRQRLTLKEWEEIASWVGRLPLALAVLNRALRPDCRAFSPGELLRAARARTGVAAHLDTAADRLADPDVVLRGATAAFRLSFDTLPARAQRAACRLACLGTAPIPRDLATAIGPDDADAIARTTLITRSFLLPPDDADAPSADQGVAAPEMLGSMHGVLADALRGFSPVPQADDDLRIALDALHQLFTPNQVTEPDRWPLLVACTPHALAAAGFAEAVAERDGDSLTFSFRLVDLRLGAGSLERFRGNYAACRALEEQTLALGTQLLGPEHRYTLTSASNLALTLQAQGDLAGARTVQEHVLAVNTRLHGAEHPDTLTNTNNLADTLRAQGDLAGARTLQEQVLTVRTPLLGMEHPDTLTSANNLAATLRAQGNLVGARTLEKQVFAALTRLLGPEHPYTLMSANNLALTLHAQGDLAGARTLEKQVLAARTRLLGAEHPDTLTSANNLAETLRAQGELAGARTLQEQVLVAFTRRLGAEHPDTLTSMNNLALVLFAQGDAAGACRLEEQVVEAFTRTLGPDHPHTHVTVANLAVFQAAADRPHQAE